jgi:molecular chaperone DnaJ
VSPQRDWFEKDFYKVLGVSSDASDKEITKAYRKLARQLHPDRNPGDAKAEERFKEVAAAYDVLGDSTKRTEYDEVRRMGPVGSGLGGGFGGFGGGARPGGGASTFNFEAGDLGDLLGGLFGRGGRRAPTGPQRGDDLEAELHLSFEDGANGVTTTVHLTSDAPCRTCHGSGARPGTSPRTCPRCNGRGVLDENQGLFSFSQPCDRCGGRGRVIEEPCPTCGGRGLEQRPRQVKVRIPPGVRDNQTIRLKGKGGPGRNGGPAGDLFVRVRVSEHPIFGRSGDNLTITLDGSTVTVRIPPGTASGRTFRVRSRGVTTANKTGDLLVTVEVVVPQKLSAAQKKAVEALAATIGESPRQHLGV